jgi:hypothetical protein
MSSIAPTTFEMRGEFRGFFRDLLGKRRMVLRVAGEELYLKVPKELRQVIERRIMAGDEVVVHGTEESGDRRAKRLVSQVWLAAEPGVCAICPIEVCTKKNCWRQGGKELWSELEHRLAKAGLQGLVELQGVDCLDRCKHAPNADWNDHEFEDCGPRDVEAIVAKVQEGLNTRVLP